jgi:hypothetical protein
MSIGKLLINFFSQGRDRGCERERAPRTWNTVPRTKRNELLAQFVGTRFCELGTVDLVLRDRWLNRMSWMSPSVTQNESHVPQTIFSNSWRQS